MSASLVSAVFSAHALLALSMARVKSSLAFTERKRVSDSLISVSPSSFRTAMALMPSSSSLDSPFMKAMNPAAGSLCHRARNSSSVMPATRAKSSSASPPSTAATSIILSALLMAVPPAWASRPTDDSAAAKPRIWLSVSPTCLPAAASLSAISIMEPSVVAKLLPSSTTVEPRFFTMLWSVWAIFMNLAMTVAASEPLRSSVDTDKSCMVRVNSAMLSLYMPS